MQNMYRVCTMIQLTPNFVKQFASQVFCFITLRFVRYLVKKTINIMNLQPGKDYKNSKSDWRQTKSSLKSKLKYILQHEFLADVSCLVGEEGEDQVLLKCHSLILSMSSPIFEKIYYKESHESVSKHWHFPMFSPIAFQKFLLYIYTEDFSGTEEDVIDLIYIAHDFQVTSLVVKCTELIQSIVTPSNCTLFYSKIHEFGISELEMFLREYIVQNAEDVMKTEGFTNISFDSLEALIKEPGLRHIDQVLLFKTLIIWAEKECDRLSLGQTTLQLKEVLGNLLDYVNFTQFSTIEFTQFVLPSALLPESKSLRILSKIIEIENQTTESSSRRVIKSIQKSKSSPRVRFKLERFQNIVPASHTNTTKIFYAKEKLCFKCTKSICLDGIGLFCSTFQNSDDQDQNKFVTLNLSVVDSSEKLIGNISRSCLPSTKSNGITNCSFEQPIRLNPSKWYTIWAELISSKGVYCSIGQRPSELYEFKVNEETYGFIFQCFNSKSEGQFPVLHFSL